MSQHLNQLSLNMSTQVLTSTRESSKQVQKKMNLTWGQQKNQCIDMSNNVQLKREAYHKP